MRSSEARARVSTVCACRASSSFLLSEVIQFVLKWCSIQTRFSRHSPNWFPAEAPAPSLTYWMRRTRRSMPESRQKRHHAIEHQQDVIISPHAIIAHGFHYYQKRLRCVSGPTRCPSGHALYMIGGNRYQQDAAFQPVTHSNGTRKLSVHSVE